MDCYITVTPIMPNLLHSLTPVRSSVLILSMNQLFPLQSDGNTALAASDIWESQTLVASAVAEQCSGRTSESSGIVVSRGFTSKPFGITNVRLTLMEQVSALPANLSRQ
jgi:hypothetical protein